MIMSKKKTIKGEIKKLEVITYDSALVSTRNILNIVETNWSHGVDCVYNRQGLNFYDVLRSSSLYLAPIGSRFVFNYNNYLSGEIKYLVTAYKNYLTVEASLTVQSIYPCKVVFKFPNYSLNLLTIPEYMVSKDSTLAATLYKVSEEAKAFNVLDAMLEKDLNFKNYTQLETDLFSGNIKDDEHLQEALYVCIENAFFPVFKNLFITLAYMDFLKERGIKTGRKEDGTFYLSDENLSYILGECNKVESVPSYWGPNVDSIINDLKFLEAACEDYIKSDDIRDVFEATPILKRFTADNTNIYVQQLKEMLGKDIDCNYVDASATFCYILLDENGLVYKTKGYAENTLAKYQISFSGYARESDGARYSFLMKKTISRYKVLMMGTSDEIVDYLSTISGKDYSNSKAAEIIREEDYCCLEHSLGDNLDYNNYYFDCCKELFDLVSTTSTIVSEEYANFYLYALICRLKALGYEKINRKVFTIPFVSKAGTFVKLYIDDLRGMLSSIQPKIYEGPLKGETPVVFYNNPNYLKLKPFDSLDVDTNSITHILHDSSNRISKVLSMVTATDINEYIAYSINLTKQMLQVDPNYAQPLYSVRDNRIYHMIPFMFNGVPVGSLLVKNNRVCTLYSGEMTLRHASIFNSSVPVWLDTIRLNLTNINN